MKNSLVFIVLIFASILSCKKDETCVTTFTPGLIDGQIYFDSISYAIINYSEIKENDDTTALMDPGIFSNSVKVSWPFSVTLIDGHAYHLKKFDLFDKAGKLVYYIPYRTHFQSSGGMTLPFAFKGMNRTLVLPVTKKY